MSRTYRLRRLRQPEGGRDTRRFVDARVRFPSDVAEEAFLSNLAHDVLGRPCVLKGGPNARCQGWDQTHAWCLPVEHRELLWGLRQANHFYRLGWTRVVWTGTHPVVGFGLASVPSRIKKENRKIIHRKHRRTTKRLLRVLRWPEKQQRSGLEFDWDDMVFPDVEASLAYDAFWLTW